MLEVRAIGRSLAALICCFCLAGSFSAAADEREQPLEFIDEGLEIVQIDRREDWISVTYEFENRGERRIGIGAVRCESPVGDESGSISASDRITSADLPHGTQRGVVLLKVGETANPGVECRVEVSHWMAEGRYVEAADAAVAAQSPDSRASATTQASDTTDSALADLEIDSPSDALPAVSEAGPALSPPPPGKAQN